MSDKPIELVEIDSKTVNTEYLAGAILADAEDAYKVIGHIEAAEFMLTVNKKMIAEAAIKIKKNKLFKHFVITDESGNCRHVSNFEEFCYYKLKKSRQRVEELVRNHNLIGPELYEKAEKIGFGQRDYNALKALPEDDRKVINQAIEEENLSKALDLMSLMAAKHQAEKESAKKQRDELTATLDAKDAVIDQKTQELNKKSEQLALLENKQRTITVDEKTQQARDAMQRTAEQIKAVVMTSLRKAVKDLHELDGDHSSLSAACLIEIGRELAILRGEYLLPETVSEDLTPEWMRPEVMAKIEAQYNKGA